MDQTSATVLACLRVIICIVELCTATEVLATLLRSFFGLPLYICVKKTFTLTLEKRPSLHPPPSSLQLLLPQSLQPLDLHILVKLLVTLGCKLISARVYITFATDNIYVSSRLDVVRNNTIMWDIDAPLLLKMNRIFVHHVVWEFFVVLSNEELYRIRGGSVTCE